MSALLFDSSTWIAALFPSHPFYAQAQHVLKSATMDHPIIFCRATQVSFLRLITTPQLLRQYDAEHMTNRAALTILQSLLSRPEIMEIDEPSGTVPLWYRLSSYDMTSPKVWMDAYLAAFAITGKLQLVTLDKDFKNFESQGLQLLLLHPQS